MLGLDDTLTVCIWHAVGGGASVASCDTLECKGPPCQLDDNQLMVHVPFVQGHLQLAHLAVLGLLLAGWLAPAAPRRLLPRRPGNAGCCFVGAASSCLRVGKQIGNGPKQGWFPRAQGSTSDLYCGSGHAGNTGLHSRWRTGVVFLLNGMPVH